MNHKKVIVAICMIALTSSNLFFTACIKKNKLTDAEISAVQDGSTADGTSQETQNLAEQAHTFGAPGMRLMNNAGMLSNCAHIDIDSSHAPGMPDTLTIDFGPTPCICHDNRYRQGQMIVIYTGKYRNPNAVIDIHFNNYSVGVSPTDMYAVDNSSTKHIVNNGLNANNYFSWTVTSSFIMHKSNNGGTISYTENKLRTQIAGTPMHFDWTDKFDISGSANGSAANGTSFTAQTESGHDLLRDMSCRKHFTEGKLDITPSGKSMITIDFGNGACDNSATITRNGVTRTITLR